VLQWLNMADQRISMILVVQVVGNSVEGAIEEVVLAMDVIEIDIGTGDDLLEEEEVILDLIHLVGVQGACRDHVHHNVGEQEVHQDLLVTTEEVHQNLHQGLL